MTKRRTLPPVFSGEIFENGWLWTAASEQSKIFACNVIRFLTIKFLSALFHNVTLNVNVEFLKIVYKTSVTMRSLEIRTQRILNNLIRQNQKLGCDSVLRQSTTASRVQSQVSVSVSSVQSPGSSVQHPTLASRHQE